ncbi:MAG: hypothetical protein ABEJ95_05215 [Candidatus Nanohalobium sp.]
MKRFYTLLVVLSLVPQVAGFGFGFTGDFASDSPEDDYLQQVSGQDPVDRKDIERRIEEEVENRTERMKKKEDKVSSGFLSDIVGSIFG